LQQLMGDLLTLKQSYQDLLFTELSTHIYVKKSTPPPTASSSYYDEEKENEELRISFGRKSFRSSFNAARTSSPEAETSVRVSRDTQQFSGDLHSVFSPFYRGSERKSTAAVQFHEDSRMIEDVHEFPLERLLAYETAFEYLKDPEGDTVRYMVQIVHAINMFRSLGASKRWLGERVKYELKNIIEQETTKVKTKYSSMQPTKTTEPNTTLGGMAAKFSADTVKKLKLDQATQALQDILDGVFHAFKNILKSVIEVTTWIDTLLDPVAAKQTARTLDVSPFVTTVWSEMQEVITRLLNTYLDSKDISSSSANNVTSKEVGSGQLRLTFSFDASSDVSVVFKSSAVLSDHTKAFNSKREREKEVKDAALGKAKKSQRWLEVTPFHMARCYRKIILFSDEGSSMVSSLRVDAKNNEAQRLRKFAQSYIERTYLNFASAEFTIQLNKILNNSMIFQETPESEEKGFMLARSSLEFVGILKNIYEQTNLLPHSVERFIPIMETQVQRFLDKYSEAYSDATANSLVGKLLTDPGMMNLMTLDPHYQAIRQTREQPLSEAAFFSDVNQLFNTLWRHTANELPPSSLLKDPKNWSMLGLLAQSLDWLSDKIISMPDQLDVISAGAKKTTGASENSHRKMGSSSSFKSGEVGAPIPTLLQSKSTSLATSCQLLGDKCLEALRLEVFIRILTNLRKMRQGAYWILTDALEPESFVTNVNEDLIAMEDVLANVLSTEKIQYLLGGCAQLMMTVLIKSLPELDDKRVNDQGISKIHRNILALQQTLTNISLAEDDSFDRARRYFRMLSSDYSDSKEDNSLFSSKELEALRDIKTEAFSLTKGKSRRRQAKNDRDKDDDEEEA
jgi:hypothetical protein